MKPHPFPRSGFTLIELLTVIAIIGILAAILIPTVGAVRNTARTSACASNMRQIGQAAMTYVTDNKGFFPLNNGNLSTGNRWTVQLKPYIKTNAVHGYQDPVFYCSTAPASSYAPGGNGYGIFGVSERFNGSAWPSGPVTIEGVIYNYTGQTHGKGVNISKVPSPSRVIMLGETPVIFTGNINPNLRFENFYSANYTRGAAANHRSDGDANNGDGKSNYLYADGHVKTLPKWPGQAAFEIK
jgi:prepilin-type N-terminal cleavage/methylation domain-containing protein/prepilin-type processing-associated H-X9-DG protein